jgi:hypothetical protein
MAQYAVMANMLDDEDGWAAGDIAGTIADSLYAINSDDQLVMGPHRPRAQKRAPLSAGCGEALV